MSIDVHAVTCVFVCFMCARASEFACVIICVRAVACASALTHTCVCATGVCVSATARSFLSKQLRQAGDVLSQANFFL